MYRTANLVLGSAMNQAGALFSLEYSYVDGAALVLEYPGDEPAAAQPHVPELYRQPVASIEEAREVLRAWVATTQLRAKFL